MVGLAAILHMLLLTKPDIHCLSFPLSFSLSMQLFITLGNDPKIAYDNISK